MEPSVPERDPVPAGRASSAPALDRAQLAALAAVVATGSFEAAAARLHVTPSAVSQRIKALEQGAGQVLVRRSRPARATAAGQVLVRLAGQVALLEGEAARALRPGPADAVTLAVAVNADSLSSWFPAALTDLPDGVLLDLRREDQDHSAELLRDGSVMAAVTGDGRPVQGCRVRPLGAMRYLGVAAPAFRERWFGAARPDVGPDATPAGRPGAEGASADRPALPDDALAVAPVLTFDRKDLLQERFLRSLSSRRHAPPVHLVPSSSAYVEMVRAGLGWGMVPAVSARADLRSGALVELAPGAHLDVPLHWQHWKLESAALAQLTARVVAAAADALEPVADAGAGAPRRTGRARG